MSERLKIGLVGAGVFAGYHAGKLAAHPRVVFLGVFDPDEDRATALAETHAVASLTAEALFKQADAVVIACPAAFHGEMAIAALEAGCHCLIEKPIATSLAAADHIVSLSRAQNLIVQVGHQERLVMRAIGLDQVTETPTSLSAIRANGYSARGTDTSVTLDLMSHDLDLCGMLFRAAPDSVTGQSQAVRSETPDMAEATLIYGAAVAKLTASRVSETPERHMVITYPSGRVTVDFNAKTLDHDTPFKLNANFGQDDLARDSLGAATNIFVAAILDGTPVSVSAEEGRLAMQLALQIDEGISS